MGTKTDPGKFDCYANAEPDEPVFILLARDPAAPGAIFRWAEQRRHLIARGIKPASDLAMIEEAEACAQEMRRWRADNRPAKRVANA